MKGNYRPMKRMDYSYGKEGIFYANDEWRPIIVGRTYAERDWETKVTDKENGKTYLAMTISEIYIKDE